MSHFNNILYSSNIFGATSRPTLRYPIKDTHVSILKCALKMMVQNLTINIFNLQFNKILQN